MAQKKLKLKKKAEQQAKANKANALKLCAALAPVTTSLTNALKTRMTKKIRDKVPSYIIDEAESTLRDLEEAQGFWTKVLNDGSSEKFEEPFTKTSVLGKVADGKSVNKRLLTSIEIANV